MRPSLQRDMEVWADWARSRAYDMNPDPDADGLKLNISDVENALNPDNCSQI